MAGFVVTTETTPKKAKGLARDVARDLEYSVSRLDDWTFRATKSSLALSILLGTFIPYCCFVVEINDGKYEGEVDIVINRNSPWWTGLIGVHRVKKRAQELAKAIADALEDKGSRIIKEKEF